ncbi:cation:proton antiporter [Corallincola spongiicola]|uniref:Potassium transporter n=1 Tax=Corallincola spongiicola TaxID=2520508 RepID=A0ABY1WRX4_9GAMM|nr:cation:proton antiporter [Corallincola spongiicola]TAA47454.1 potassium transporter [Corallincola spongiicola]
MTAYLGQAFVYLVAAVIMVPLAKRFGLGSVLGYLVAGVVIGPLTGLVGAETETLQHVAEFGVVIMLFLVGLELQPQMLWQMRSKLIGLGGMQVAGSALLISGTALLFSVDWRMAVAIGLIFALSSTAIVLQSHGEKGWSHTEGGRSSFSVLLFQDIAVIPILAFLPFLAMPEPDVVADLVHGGAEMAGAAGEHHADDSLADLPPMIYGLAVIGAISIVIIVGQFLSTPLFRFVAKSGLREVFTATALALVVGISALMSMVGLSPALGTFLAGVVLANSEFRHELESNIEPFKGLLLGLFFITVGAGISFTVLVDNLGFLIGVTVAVIFAKALVLYLLSIVFKVRGSDRWILTLSLAQAGEFGFVLLAFSLQINVLTAEMVELLAMVVALSMFLTPLLFILLEKVLMPKMEKATNEQQEEDVIDEKGQVIIAGVGRFGQIVNRLLLANGVSTTVLDHEAQRVDLLRQICIKSYFGDATRLELLHTAGIDEASLLVVAIDDRERAIHLVQEVKRHYPNLTVLARAFDRGDEYQLEHAGADIVVKETYHSALYMGGEALKALGYHPFQAENLKQAFNQVELDNHPELRADWISTKHEKGISASYKELFIKLDGALVQAMKKDRSDTHSHEERGWTPPPAGYDDLLEAQQADHTDGKARSGQ